MICKIPICKIPLLGIMALLGASWATAQDPSAGVDQEHQDKRVFGIIPNYLTSPTPEPWKPLTMSEKFKEASQDAFDQGTFILAGIFGAQSQLTNSNRAFGQGAAGFSRYFGAAYGDLLIGNYMSEAALPILLHQDPPLFPARHGNRGRAAALCDGADLPGPRRFRPRSVQLFGGRRQLCRGRDIQRLLRRRSACG